MAKPGPVGISQDGNLTQLTPEQENLIEHLFTIHKCSDPQSTSILRVTVCAKIMARVILQECPDSVDRYDAIRKLRETVHMANASIALKGIS